ncbi:MAG: 4Fe-4S binding protein [Chthonomonadales bacterium]
MKELVVLSGKGGTGKTSFAAAFVNLAGRCAITDCDVDAADLHLVLAPEVQETVAFAESSVAVVDPHRCGQCGLCMELCRFGAIRPNDRFIPQVDPFACEGCRVCARFCPAGAVSMREVENGVWFRSKTRFGPFFHARLRAGAENSGRLVELLRRHGREAAEDEGLELLITDGPPGVGCPAISAVTGSAYAVLIAEPTVSGVHDLERIAAVVGQMGIPAGVVVNEADLNMAVADQIERWAAAGGLDVLGRVPYDPLFTRAQIEGRSIVEYDGGASRAVERVWQNVEQRILGLPN